MGRGGRNAGCLAALVACIAGGTDAAGERAAEPLAMALLSHEALVESEAGLVREHRPEQAVRVRIAASQLAAVPSLRVIRGARARVLPVARVERRGDHLLVTSQTPEPPLEEGPARLAVSAGDQAGSIELAFASEPAFDPELARAIEARDIDALEAALSTDRLSARARLALATAIARLRQHEPELDTVIEAWSRAADAALAAGVPTEATRAWRAIAYHAVLRRRYDLAEPMLARAEALDRRHDHTIGLLRAALYRGIVAKERGLYREATRILTEAAEQALREGHDDEAAHLVKTLAPLLQDQGLHTRARESIESVRARLYDHGSPAERMTYANDYGWVLLRGMHEGAWPVDYDRPRRLFAEALEIARSSGNDALEISIVSNLLWTAHLAGDDPARTRWLASLRAHAGGRTTHAAHFVALLDAEIVLSSGRWAEAYDAFRRAFDEASQEAAGGPSDYVWRASFGMARAAAGAGHDGRAATSFRDAVAQLEDMQTRVALAPQRGLFVSDRDELFQVALGFFADRRSTDDVFAVASARATGLLRTAQAIPRLSRLDPDSRRRWDTLIDRYRAARAAHEAERDRQQLLGGEALARFRREMDAGSARLRRLLDDAHAVLDEAAPVDHSPTLDEVRRALRSDETLIAFVSVGDGETLAIVARPDGAEMRAVAEPSLAELLDGLDGVSHVYVAPWAPGSEEVHAERDANGDPILARVSVSYLADPGLLARSDPDEDRPFRALVVSDPDRDLPHARAEGADVARALPASTLLDGAGATRAAVVRELAHATSLHFAGHARRGDSPFDLYLDLAGSERLSLRDLLAVRSPALVVLSGCATADAPALGSTRGIGLADAFLIGGARSVLAAHGDIPDEAARSFVGTFYDRGGTKSPAEAFRRAALETGDAAIVRAFSLRGLR